MLYVACDAPSFPIVPDFSMSPKPKMLGGPGVCKPGEISTSKGEISLVLGFWCSCCTVFREVGAILAGKPTAELKSKSMMTFEAKCDNWKGFFYWLIKKKYLLTDQSLVQSQTQIHL